MVWFLCFQLFFCFWTIDKNIIWTRSCTMLFTVIYGPNQTNESPFFGYWSRSEQLSFSWTVIYPQKLSLKRWSLWVHLKDLSVMRPVSLFWVWHVLKGDMQDFREHRDNFWRNTKTPSLGRIRMLQNHDLRKHPKNDCLESLFRSARSEDSITHEAKARVVWLSVAWFSAERMVGSGPKVAVKSQDSVFAQMSS